jgi:chromosomal replication initiation ATPase DnaA
VTRQLAFDLARPEAMTRADFFVSPANALTLQTVESWQDWPGNKLLLIGPEGAGKTHLAHIWADLSGATILQAKDFASMDLSTFTGQRVVVEDADRIGPAEAALFHLHNLVTGSGALLLTAETPPRDWGLTLPDLISRMQAAAIARLEPPDDALLSAVLIKLFADRQITVPANLIPYLISRMPRSIGAARALVGALDARAMALGRPVTRQLAAEVLGAE